MNVLDVSAYLYTGKDVRIRKQSVKNLGFIKQLEFVVLDLDMFTSVKSHDLNYKLFQRTIKKLHVVAMCVDGVG